MICAAWVLPDVRRLGVEGVRRLRPAGRRPAPSPLLVYVARQPVVFGRPMQISGDIKRVDLTPAPWSSACSWPAVVGLRRSDGQLRRLEPSDRFERLTGLPGRHRLVRPVLHRPGRLLHAALVPDMALVLRPARALRHGDLLVTAAPTCSTARPQEGPTSLRAVQAILLLPLLGGFLFLGPPVPRPGPALDPGGQPGRRAPGSAPTSPTTPSSPRGTRASSAASPTSPWSTSTAWSTAASSPTPWPTAGAAPSSGPKASPTSPTTAPSSTVTTPSPAPSSTRSSAPDGHRDGAGHGRPVHLRRLHHPAALAVPWPCSSTNFRSSPRRADPPARNANWPPIYCLERVDRRPEQRLSRRWRPGRTACRRRSTASSRGARRRPARSGAPRPP